MCTPNRLRQAAAAGGRRIAALRPPHRRCGRRLPNSRAAQLLYHRFLSPRYPEIRPTDLPKTGYPSKQSKPSYRPVPPTASTREFLSSELHPLATSWPKTWQL